jgi:hypothetical protein
LAKLRFLLPSPMVARKVMGMKSPILGSVISKDLDFGKGSPQL